ncbi:MAG TPA: hypothetical protein VFE14_12615 [Micromonosporaceae bacterium]|nr:hypothetical protein [Micromonosporaceae bacterium]
MSTRRSHLATLGLAVTGLSAIGVTAAPSPAFGSAPGEPFRLTARRAKITIPDLPALGLTYIAMLDLFDEAGAAVGQAAAGASIVDITLDGPVVLASVVLKLADGEIHYQRLMNRFGEFPRAATGAILGGTGTYHDIRGTVDISWPDADRVELVVQPVP